MNLYQMKVDEIMKVFKKFWEEKLLNFKIKEKHFTGKIFLVQRLPIPLTFMLEMILN